MFSFVRRFNSIMAFRKNAFHFSNRLRLLFLLFVVASQSFGSENEYDAYHKKYLAHLYGNYDSTLHYVNRLEAIAIKTNNRLGMAKAYLAKGNTFLLWGQNVDSIENLADKGIGIAKREGDSVLVAYLLNLKGGYYANSGNRKGSLECHKANLEIGRKLNNQYIEQLALSGIAGYYYSISDFEEALGYYKSAIEIAHSRDDKKAILTSQNNLGYCLLYLKRFDEALNCANQNIELSKELDKPNSLMVAFILKGELLNALERYKEAELMLEAALELSEGAGNKTRQAGASYVLALVLFNSEQYVRAEATALLGLKSADDALVYQVKDNLYQLLARIHLKLNNTTQVYKFMNLHKNLSDSLRDERLAKTRVDLEKRFELNEKELEISELNHESELKNLQLWASIISSVLLLLAAIAIISAQRNRIRKTKLQKMLADAKQQQLESKLGYQNRTLTAYTLQMQQNNHLFESIGRKIEDLEESQSIDNTAAKSIKLALNNIRRTDSEWDQFKIFFTEVHPNFLRELDKMSSDLTNQEIRQATLIKLGLSLKEAASVLNIAPDSVKMARIRLKKKLGLSQKQDLMQTLRKLGDSQE